MTIFTIYRTQEVLTGDVLARRKAEVCYVVAIIALPSYACLGF